jgi:hypothetical protein
VVARARYLAILTLNQVLWLLVVEFYRITYSPPLGALKYPTSWCGSLCGGLQVKSPEWRKANEIGRWSMEMMGCPLGLIYSTVGHSMRT